MRSDAMTEMLPLSEAIRLGHAAELGIKTKVKCPTCSSMVNQSDLIPMGDKTLCPNCRNQYLQSLKEGVPITEGEYDFAGFGIRFAGTFIDGLIMYAYGIVLNLAFGLGVMGQDTNEGFSSGMMVIYMVLSYAVPFAYAVLMLGGKTQATLGMMAVKIRIITVEGEDCSYLRAVGRYFAAFISAMILGIGYLMVLWDKNRQTLHDKICNTYVIKK